MASKADDLGARIRELRYRRGISQAQLAVRAGVGEKTLSRLEAGKTDAPHPETLAAVAGALGIAPTELFEPARGETTQPLQQAPALHQLPSPPRNFTGRMREIAELCDAPNTPALTGIHGMGGIGKTALALEVAERWSERFPDGQLYLDLHGTTDAVSPVDAMLHVIRSIDPGRPAPNTDAGVAAAYRSVLRGKRVLLLMDNAADREQVEPLLPPDGSALLVTSRQRFAMPGLRSSSLAPLDRDEAETLIQSLAPRVQSAGAELAEPCGGLPLALSLVGRALAERPDLDAGELATRLSDDRQRLSQLDAPAGAGGVEASFTLSYEMLDEATREGLCVFSIFPQHFDRAAAAAVWDLTEIEADSRIGQLVRFHLLESSGSGASARYRLHDLVRLFAGARLDAGRREAARMRYAAHYIGLLELAEQALRADRRTDEPAADELGDTDREWAHVATAFASCQALASRDETARDLCCRAADAATVLRLRLDPRTRIRWFEAAIGLAGSRNAHTLEARLSVHMARAHQELGDARRAIALCERALALLPADGESATRALALVALGDAYHAVGDPQHAIEHGEQALALARETGARNEEASALVVLGWGYRVQGNLARAIACCEQALPIAREFRDRTLEASAVLALGFAHQARGEIARGREYGETALRIARAIGDRRIEGYSLIVLGERQGTHAYDECLEIARETGDRRMTGNALLAIGFSHNGRGRAHDAVAAFEESLAIAKETDDRSMEGIALTALGIATTTSGDLARSLEVLSRAEEVSRAMGNHAQEAVAAWLLGCAHELRGESEPAIAAMERSEAFQAATGFPALAETRRRIAALRARRSS